MTMPDFTERGTVDQYLPGGPDLTLEQFVGELEVLLAHPLTSPNDKLVDVARRVAGRRALLVRAKQPRQMG